MKTVRQQTSAKLFLPEVTKVKISTKVQISFCERKKDGKVMSTVSKNCQRGFI